MQNIKPVTMKKIIKAQGGPVGSIMVFSVVVVGSSVVVGAVVGFVMGLAVVSVVVVGGLGVVVGAAAVLIQSI